MLSIIRERLLQALLQTHEGPDKQLSLIQQALTKRNITHYPIDHFATIDLPSAQSGIPHLTKLFGLLGFMPRGKGYLPDKQNDFMWLSVIDADNQPASTAPPQIVVADFRPWELPEPLQNILAKYTQHINSAPFETFQRLLEKSVLGNEMAYQQLETLFLDYFQGRAWPLPTREDYEAIAEFNMLLAWVLVFGRKPNHFTLAIHLMKEFPSLSAFLAYIQTETSLVFNDEGGLIKGKPEKGIEQASTLGSQTIHHLKNGSISIPDPFVEFVFRYPKHANPVLWGDYFTGFVAEQANYVIESLY